MGALITRLLIAFKGLRGLLVALLGQSNLLGWSVAAVIPAAFIALWVAVLHYGFVELDSYLSVALANGDIFGGSGIPSGGLWLIQQAFPLQLFFTLTVTLIVFKLAASHLLITAISASRYLKGK